MDQSPIALFVYNRPWHTRQTVESLLKNELAEQSDLIVFADGVRKTETEKRRNGETENLIKNRHRTSNIPLRQGFGGKVEHSTSNSINKIQTTDNQRLMTHSTSSGQSNDRIREVREYIRSIKGFKSVRIVEREKNLGLANSIISGVTEVVNEYGRIIVLEDDMVTSPYFLKFMNDALNLYEDEEKVISIHGYLPPLKAKLPETFFLKGADCWGWATWKRGWDLFDPDGEKLLRQLKEANLMRRFDFNGAYPYSKMLIDQIKGKNNSWAVRWYASALLQDKLTLHPGRSLLSNIGTDASGTHHDETKYFNTSLNLCPIDVRKADIKEEQAALTSFGEYLRRIPKAPFSYRLLRKLRRIVNSYFHK